MVCFSKWLECLGLTRMCQHLATTIYASWHCLVRFHCPRMPFIMHSGSNISWFPFCEIFSHQMGTWYYARGQCGPVLTCIYPALCFLTPWSPPFTFLLHLHALLHQVFSVIASICRLEASDRGVRSRSAMKHAHRLQGMLQAHKAKKALALSTASPTIVQMH